MKATLAHPENGASGNVYPASVLVRMIVALLAPLVAKELQSKASEDDTGDPWIHQVASPLGRRAHCRACKEGKIEGARFHRRKWLARRSAIDAYIAQNGAAAPSAPVAAANDTDEPTIDDVARVLAGAGLAYAPRRGARR